MELPEQFQLFLDAYLECLFWSETTYDSEGEGDENFEEAGFTPDDLREESSLEILQDCVGFYIQYYSLIKDNLSRAGHDFCLTRNGHGAGFWDGDWEEPAASKLTDGSKAYGNQGLMTFETEDGNTLVQVYS